MRSSTRPFLGISARATRPAGRGLLRGLAAGALLLAAPHLARAQSVGIGTSAPAASAALEVSATTKGFLPPRLTQAQRDAIAAPAPGLTIFNTDSRHLNVWDGTQWTAALLGTETGYAPAGQAFGFTGGPQTYTVPWGVTSISVTARGASGLAGTSSPFPPGGKGAEVRATLPVTPGEVLTVFVGGTATLSPIRGDVFAVPLHGGGGYNGGGQGPRTSRGYIGGSIYDFVYWGAGGGASDIRRGGTALTDRVLVAGGGGGTGLNAPGGDGGAPNGTAGASGGQGGTLTAGGAAGGNSFGVAENGSLGVGGNSAVNQRAGGGGGYYGGGGSNNGGGGGGSSWVTAAGTNVTMTAGAVTGPGTLTISPNPAVQYAAPVFSGANVVLPGSPDGSVVFSSAPGLKTDPGQLFWDAATNRLGLGTAAPTFPLHTVGGVYSSGAGGEFTFADRADNSKRFSWYATNDRATLWHSGTSDRLTVTKDGRLGLNTTTPGAALDVVGGGAGSIDLTVNGRLRTGDGNNAGGMYLNAANTQFVGQYDANRMGLFNLDWRLVVANNGFVGIGTVSPAYPLDIRTSVTASYGGYGYVNQPGDTGYSPWASNVPVSVYASGRILALEFNAVSDRRLKTIVGRSDNATDLALLTKLRITDYHMRDRVQYGARAFKKVIAQEVEAVFPQAVEQHTGFLPDVYALATSALPAPDSLLRLTLPQPLAGATAAGQRLKLIGPHGEVTATLARPAAAGSTALVLRGAAALASQKVFVFGFEHADVRSVDYEALAMLNVSATQELARRVAHLEAQNAAWQRQTAADHASLLTLQAQLARLLGEAAAPVAGRP